MAVCWPSMKIAIVALALLVGSSSLAKEPVQVDRLCAITDEKVTVYVDVVTQDAKTKAKYRALISIDCDKHSKECLFTHLGLDGLEKKNRFGYFDLQHTAKGELIQVTKSIAVIKSFSWTFTLNTATGKLAVNAEAGLSKSVVSGEADCPNPLAK